MDKRRLQNCFFTIIVIAVCYGLAWLYVGCWIFACSYYGTPERIVTSPNTMDENNNISLKNEKSHIHLISFSTSLYSLATKRVLASGLDIGKVDYTHIYRLKDLDLEYWKKNEHILTQKRGAGYWIWKSYFIYKHLIEHVKFGDVLIYCDSMFDFQQDVRPFLEKHLKEQNDVIVFQYKPNEQYDKTKNLEKRMSKHDAFYLLGIDYDTYNEEQPWAGFIIIKKSLPSLRFISEWFTYVQGNIY